MSEPPAPAEPDVTALHQRFAVDLNNAIWDAVSTRRVAPDSPPTERDRLLYGAYAAAFHWLQVGTPINQARAEHLIARSALQVGRYDVALHHARRCAELVAENPDAAEDWDLAFAQEALARASAASGDLTSGRTHLAEAERLGALIADAEDRAVFASELASGDWYGLR